MDDLTGKIQALLSDPESLRQFSELAEMLRQPEHEQAAGESAAEEAAQKAEGPDLSKLLAVGQILAQTQQGDDNTAFLLALKPHLSPARQQRVGRAVRLLTLYRAASVLQENGLLSELLSGI